jgi:hypothetical protein
VNSGNVCCQDLESFGSHWKLFYSMDSINKHLNDKLIRLSENLCCQNFESLVNRLSTYRPRVFRQPVETVLQYGYYI